MIVIGVTMIVIGVTVIVISVTVIVIGLTMIAIVVTVIVIVIGVTMKAIGETMKPETRIIRDYSPTGNQAVAGSTPAVSATFFMEIDHEIFSLVSLSFLLIQEG